MELLEVNVGDAGLLPKLTGDRFFQRLFFLDVSAGKCPVLGMDDDKDCKSNYIVLGPEAEDGGRLCLHHKHGETMLKKINVVKDGQPIHGDILTAEHRAGNIFDVTGEYSPPRSGPPKVVSQAYRQNWDQIFGKRAVVGQA